jgi:hypothetical protein
MANEDVLRLRATIVNEEFLANIRTMGRELGLMPQKGRGIKTMSDDFGKFGQVVRKVGGDITQVIPALSGLGLGAAGAAGAIAALSVTLINSAKKVVELKYASKELGVSERDLRAWGIAAEKVGISAASMQSGMEAFKKTTDGLKYNIGGARDELYALGAGPVVQRMQAATNQLDKMRIAFATKDELMKEDPSGFKAKMWFDAVGIGADKTRLSFEQYETAMKRLKQLTKEQEEAAEKFAGSLVDLGAAWDQLITKAGTGIFPKLTQDMKDLQGLLSLLD